MSDVTEHNEGADSPSTGIPFDDVFTVRRAYATKAGAGTVAKAGRSGAVRLLWLRNIGRDGAIAEPDNDADEWRTDVPENHRLQVGDILLSAVVSGRAKAARVEESHLPAVAAGSILVLRPTTSLEPAHARLILAFLRSDSVAMLARGAIQQHIPPKELSRLRLPAADQALSAALEDLDEAGRMMGRWHAEAGSLGENVLNDGLEVTKARRAIIQAGQLIRMRAEAAAQLDDPGYIVRTRYPYPLAQRWRDVEARMSARDRDRAYKAVLEAAEALLGYSALVAAALASEAGIPLKSVQQLKAKIAKGRGGPTFGDWTKILQGISGAEGMNDLSPEHPLHELASLLEGDEALESHERLASRRNSNAHGRSNAPIIPASDLDEAFDDLSILTTRARFLADLPLLHVTSASWNRFSQTETVSFRRLMGDHPVVPTESTQHSGPRVEPDSLYLADRDQGLHPLRPFLTCEICESCTTWSIFHADKEDGALIQKSLEHGHFYPYRADPQALRDAGLM
ncbi:restriction endonuclease [Streptomyces sp. NPDC048577]|uniref:restriction endonuclease n=1 Tax=Streptomyces sp. NPDC048577 TaxID=3157209 RepID=UPI003440B15A